MGLKFVGPQTLMGLNMNSSVAFRGFVVVQHLDLTWLENTFLLLVSKMYMFPTFGWFGW